MTSNNVEPIVTQFFQTIEATKSTRETYIVALQHYVNFCGLTMLELLEESEEDMVNKVVPRKQRLQHRLTGFNDYLLKKYSPNTKSIYMAAVKSFYKNYGMTIPRIGKSKKTESIQIENQWQGFDANEVSRHLKAVINLRDRAMILLMCSSGFAKKEIRNLKRADFEGNQDQDGVTTFRCRRAKTHFDFYTFCTPEATRAIKDYLKTRADDNAYLFLSRNEDKITDQGWGWIFRRLNRRLGFKSDNVYAQTRSHNYRKYFQTTMQNGGCDLWAVDFMMAHNTNEVRANYHMADPDKLKEVYKSHMHLLAIDDKSFELMKDDEVKRIMADNKQQAAELAEMKERMESFEADKSEISTELMTAILKDPAILEAITEAMQKKDHE